MSAKQDYSETLNFKKVDYSKIESLRNNYLDQLYEAQELYLEMIVETSDYYLIVEEKTIGYFVLTKDNTLVEFFLISQKIPDAEALFKALLDYFEIKKVWCKSFDSLLLKCCLPLHSKTSYVGYSFRDYLKPSANEKSQLSFRLAREEDIPVISKIKSGLFDTDEEIRYTVSNKNMFIYSHEDEFIGCGIFQPAVKGRKHYDIGMLVHPDIRKRGYGTMIIRHLADYCEKNNWVPVCGCAFENTASRKTLEKAGFISKHNLIELKV